MGITMEIPQTLKLGLTCGQGSPLPGIHLKEGKSPSLKDTWTLTLTTARAQCAGDGLSCAGCGHSPRWVKEWGGVIPTAEHHGAAEKGEICCLQEDR